MTGVRNELTNLPQSADPTEIPIVDELRSIWMQRKLRNFGKQSQALDIAMCAKTSRNAIQVSVVIARMTTQFKHSFRRHRLQYLTKRRSIEVAGSGDADRSIRGKNLSIADLRLMLELALKTAKQLHLKPAQTIPMAQPQAPPLLERIPHSTDRTPLRKMQKRTSDRRKKVSMFVSIDVGNIDTCALKLLYLSKRLALNIILANDAAKQCLDEVDERGTEGLTVSTKERGNAFRMRHRNTVSKDNMTADAKCRIRVRNGNSIVKRRTGSHESC